MREEIRMRLLFSALALVLVALTVGVATDLRFFSPAGAKPSAVAKKFEGPSVLEFEGRVVLTDLTGKKAPPKRGQVLREKASFETGPHSTVLLLLSPNERLFVGPSSRVAIPVINWDDGSLERVELEAGSVRLQNLTSRPRVVVTPLSRDPYSEVDLVFQLDLQNARLTAQVIEGRASFRGIENEESTSLSAGEEATFQGVIEGGEIVYDVLLQGRKAVRGKTRPKKKSAAAAGSWWSKLKKPGAIVKKPVSEGARLGSICRAPQGRLNECAWICENNPKGEKTKCREDLESVRCVRMKCDANGQWADRLEIVPSQSPCKALPLVGPCDY